MIFLAKKSELDEFSIEVSRRIFHLRKQRGLTQAQVAERASISHKFFSSVERGEKGMSAKTIVKLANALETSTDFLLTGTVNSPDDYGISQWASFLSERNAHHLREIIRNCLLLYGHEETQEDPEETE